MQNHEVGIIKNTVTNQNSRKSCNYNYSNSSQLKRLTYFTE